jgi:hypothetical protein
MILFTKEFNDLPATGKPKWQKAQMSASITREQIEELRGGYNIDAMAMLENALHNESYTMLSKLISKVIFSPRPTEIKWERESGWLADLLDPQEKEEFIVTNLQIAAGIQDMSRFKPVPLKTMNNSGALYKIGEIFDVPMYIDPMMRWDEKELAIVNGNIIEFKEDKVAIVKEETFAPRIVTTIKYKLYHPNSTVYTITNIDF